jgi:hypothetical protein
MFEFAIHGPSLLLGMFIGWFIGALAVLTVYR